jgi:hypothetical protein
MSVLSRRGAAGQAGKHGRNTHPQEPVGALIRWYKTAIPLAEAAYDRWPAVEQKRRENS